MLGEKANRIVTASNTVRQVRKRLYRAFPNTSATVRLERQESKSAILVQDFSVEEYQPIKYFMMDFLGYVDVHGNIRIPHWHMLKDGTRCHYQIDFIRIKMLSGTWEDVKVSMVDKEKSNINWRYWRLTEEEFNTTLRPYLNRWAAKNVELLFRLIVESKTQKEIAESANISRQAVNGLMQRGLKIYLAKKGNFSNLGKEN